MKTPLTLLLAFFSCWAKLGAQPTYSKVDSFAHAFKQPYQDIDDLAKQLTQPFVTDSEKARSLFIWIAANIRYDVEKFENPPPRPHFGGNTKAAMETEAMEWYKKQLNKSFKSKKGVCEDYSRIYKAMCDAIGLECVIVRGDSRDFYRPYRRVHDNPHAWNAVKWENTWHLLDATWGAGYVHDGKFKRDDGPGYFDAPPHFFVQNHLPDDKQWQLLENPLSKKDFSDQPLIQYGQNEYPILDFSPTAELQGDERVIRIKFSRMPKFFRVVLNQNKHLKFNRSLEGDWVVLRFQDMGAGKEISIYCGEKEQGYMRLFARYELR